MVTLKPANGEWPGLVVFTLSAASCLLDFVWALRGGSFRLLRTISSRRGCGNGGKQAVRFPRFPPRGSFHSLWSKAADFFRVAEKQLPYFPSNEFFGAGACDDLRLWSRGAAYPTVAAVVANSVLVRQLRGPNFST